MTSVAQAASKDFTFNSTLNKCKPAFIRELNWNGKEFGQRHGSHIAELLIHYLKEEEYDMHSIMDDITEYEDSGIIDYIYNMCSITTSPNIKDGKENLQRILRDIFSSRTPPFEIKWNINISKSDIETVRKYLNKQCNDIFEAGKDDAFLKFVVIGQKVKQSFYCYIEIYAKTTKTYFYKCLNK